MDTRPDEVTSLSTCWLTHPGVELRENLESISHRCYLREVAFVWELTKETIFLPPGCLQGGLPGRGRQWVGLAPCQEQPRFYLKS